jgi:parallel beta-helix repeat protein
MWNLRSYWRVTWVGVLAGLVFMSFFVMPAPLLRASYAYQPHAPILISGNSGFTVANGVTSGSGTASAPYVIEGWEINSTTANGIEIQNSNAYFIIRNVYIHNVQYVHYGIVLSNIANGRVENSKCSFGYSGVAISSSSNITVLNNQIFGNSIDGNFGTAGGLGIAFSKNIVVRNNNISNNIRDELVIGSSDNITIAGNILSGSGGIASATMEIYSSADLTIVNNTISHSTHFGFLLESSNRTLVYHNTFINNYPNAQQIGGTSDAWDNGYPSGGNYWADYGYYFQAADNCSGPSQNVCTGPDGIGDLPYVLQTGQKDRYPLVVHDVVVTSVETSTFVTQGRTTTISVTIQNLGNVVESSFTVALSFNNALISSQTVTGFSSFTDRMLSFSWNTGVLLERGVPPGIYILTATASNLPLEANPSDNTKSSNPVEVIGFPSTPLVSLESAGPILTWSSAIISVATAGVAVFTVLRAHFRTKKKPLD